MKQKQNKKSLNLFKGKHYYLDQVLPDDWDDPSESFIEGREKRWLKEKDIYGFDERETWCMEYEFYIWLYEHIMRYKEICCVDLTFHKFEYEGKQYTQLELMDEILERIEFWFSSYYDDKEITQVKKKMAENKYYAQYGTHNYNVEEHVKITDEIAKIWAIILPCMGW